MKKAFKITLWVAGGAILSLAAAVVVRTAVYPFGDISAPADEIAKFAGELSQESVTRLAGALRIPTVSENIAMAANNPFDRFKAYLPQVYPAVYAAMDTVTVNSYGLVFRWPGSDPQLAPVLFLAHYDVVPVAGYDGNTAAPVAGWNRPPFAGEILDGNIYGRGTLDDKGSLCSLLEAADDLIGDGFRPQRDIWFAFGFDEEISGMNGAARIAEYFAQQGLRFDAVYDEGGIIAAPGLGGIDATVALIGTAEKGYLTLRITVRGEGGHASMPPAKGALVQAAGIIERLNSRQMPARMTPPVASFLDRVGGTMNYTSRMAIANRWLLEGVLLKTMSKNPATNALVRTTTAVTMARGSDAENVLASTAQITVNFRILPGDTVGDVVKHVENLCKGYDTDIEIVSAREPSAVSPEDTAYFDLMCKSLAEVCPEAVPAGYLAVVGTDAYKYQALSDNIYRLMPALLTQAEQGTIHNANEHISLENYARMIAYFTNIFSNL